ncbi:LCP family protein, partial [Cyanobium sp. HWJ4-Hawea]|uniref:LCP family protein n=1 Tax=Cyanobium sp. HWJ4-Hawea TaxID=2823713 RepID=UPI0020CC4253
MITGAPSPAMAPRSAQPKEAEAKIAKAKAAQKGSRRRRIATRLGAAGLGLIGGLGLLALVWPESDRSLDALKNLNSADLAKAPMRPITLLVIGLDAEQVGDGLNNAAPLGPANNDALLLIRINPQGPLQVLTVPTSLGVQLPGQKGPLPLGKLYRLGGAALSADAVRELVGLGPQEPERYLVISRAGLRNLVDGLGGVNANPPMEMRYGDRKQQLKIKLDGGLQQLNGRQIEHLARFRDPLRPDESRQEHQQEVVSSLLQEMAIQEQLVRIPGLVRSLKGQVGTNLSESETLSLLAAGLANPEGVEFSSIPLAP